MCVKLISKLAQQAQKGRFGLICRCSQTNAIGTKHMGRDARKLDFGIIRIGNMANYVKHEHVLNNKSNFCFNMLSTTGHILTCLKPHTVVFICFIGWYYAG